jgi:hypothetical protein
MVQAHIESVIAGESVLASTDQMQVTMAKRQFGKPPSESEQKSRKSEM